MTDYTIGTNENGKKVIYTNHKTPGRNYGNYATLTNEHVHLIDAELIYREVWGQAKRFCEKAKVDPIRIQMIITLMHCDNKIRKEEGLPNLDMGDDTPVMTIGWTLCLTDEENARLSKEDIASIAGGIFVEEE